MRRAPWSPDSWRRFPAAQQPVYEDALALQRTLNRLRQLPPLLAVEHIQDARLQLARIVHGQGLLLQAGDCAERFADCTGQQVAARVRLLVQLQWRLAHGMGVPVSCFGRLAGQYAKPRSEEQEQRGGERLPIYRGDLVNDPAFEARCRAADPQRLLTGYSLAGLTLNHMHNLLAHAAPDAWFDAGSEASTELQEALRFASALSGETALKPQIFTCHEALLLPYEAALTRSTPDGRAYNCATHLPWIGARTADPAGAHVEYLRGVHNPIGLKISPALSPDQVLRLCEQLDPANEPGRLTLIHRFGVGVIGSHLPRLLRRLQQAGRQPLWVCDPMHGNTRSSEFGLKTRDLTDIVGELLMAAEIHHAEGGRLHGLHIEVAASPVTECIGGNVSPAQLPERYETAVDPRLNPHQAATVIDAFVRHQNSLRKADNSASA